MFAIYKIYRILIVDSRCFPTFQGRFSLLADFARLTEVWTHPGLYRHVKAHRCFMIKQRESNISTPLMLIDQGHQARKIVFLTK